MKGSGQFLIPITLATFLFVLYVHEQIALFRISYEIDSKSESLARQTEDYRRLKFEVDQLKAPRLLEEKIKTLGLNLTTPKEVYVVRVPVETTVAVQSEPVESVSLKPFSDGLLDFLGRWVKVAQAKTEN